ncbi:MAG: exosortase/archaeosortase family protein [Kangiellaceae bacterium]|nr:exosortase/archaeosortase family protein [Kangiellaceae bacterium]
MVFETKQVTFDKTNISWLIFVLLVPILGYWRAWQWYFNRVYSSLEEAISLFAILGFLLFMAGRVITTDKKLYKFSLWPIALLMTIYSLSFLLPIPSIIRATVAFLTLSMIIYWTTFGSQPPIAFWGLIMLSMPLVPSLQFYLGYPARYISASITVPLLQLNGIAVSQSGTNLVWNQQLLQFDAPCSGVTMLWAGLIISLFISMVYQFSLFKTSVALFITCVFVLIGNVLRASSLFYLETGAMSVDQPWLHEGIGVGAFLIIATGIVVALSKFQQWSAAR